MDKEKIIKEMKDFSKSYAKIPEYMYSLDLDKVEILLGYINTLKQQLKKKDEVIKKAVEYVNKHVKDDYYCRKSDYLINNLLQILGDVEDEK